jgi:hypothetical protein
MIGVGVRLRSHLVNEQIRCHTVSRCVHYFDVVTFLKSIFFASQYFTMLPINYAGVFAISITLPVLESLAVAARFEVRRRKKNCGLDDWFTLAALVKKLS